MVYYRLYHLAGAHFCGVDEFTAEDDVLAVREAREKLTAGSALCAELWCGKRRVRRLDK